jgi:hypothetical protein
MNDDQITLINISNGNKVTIYEDDPRFGEFKDLIIDGLYDEAEEMDVKVTVQNFAAKFVGNNNFSISINDGVGTVTVMNTEWPLADVVVKRITKLVNEGFDAQPLVNFLSNLYSNPSKVAVDELFLFLDKSELPITTDGHFIAYKIVRNDYMDIYSKTIRNMVGDKPEMPRFAVDDNRHNTCSRGLHFCSKGYLSSYGSSNRNDDRCMLVKVNPADVVSIPSDYDNAKGRACKYEVVGEVKDNEWRDVLSKADYNKTSVVNSDGSAKVAPKDLRNKVDWEDLANHGYYFDADNGVFRTSRGKFTPRSWVAEDLSCTVAALENLVYGNNLETNYISY